MNKHLIPQNIFSNFFRTPSVFTTDNFFNDNALWPSTLHWSGEPQIKMDIAENDKSFVVKAEVPGVNKDDIKVSIRGNAIFISAETKKEKETKEGESVIRSERFFGKQTRSFELSSDIDESEASAKYNNGILELNLPKKSGSNGPRQLTIR
jgi:HSP20 family protein